MMRPQSLIQSLFIGGALLLCAQTPALARQAAPALTAPAPAPAPAPAARTIQAHPALWVVKDADTTIYLFGTIHLLKPEVRWFDGPVRKAFDSAQQVVLEVVDQGDKASKDRLTQRAMQLDGPTITSRLPEDKRAAYMAALTANDLPPLVFDRVKPWFAALTLSVLPLRKYGYDPDSGADHVIERAASAAGKTLTGLETSDEQLGFFESLSDDVQIDLLGQTLDELPTMGDMIAQMIGAWTAGKPDQLAKLLNDSVDSNPELEKILLTDRNARWADWIKARLDQPGTVFIAVGAGHLAGDGGVQAMLRQRGLTAKRVKRVN